MNYPTPPGLGSTEIAQLTRAYAEACGVPANHPVLASVGFVRRVAALIANGQVPSVRVRNRMYCSPDVVPQVAALLGLVVAPASVAA